MNEKTWSDSNDFKVFEKKVKIRSLDALMLYDLKFSENFKDENLETYKKYFDKVIYIQNNRYYIGYVSKMDKKGVYSNDIYCLAELNPKTGEISVVK
jgi:hypothetical protein